MRFICLALFLVGCGRSECQDYATVYCQKAATCITPISIEVCEKETMRGLEAQRVTEDRCKAVREQFAAMSCGEFKAAVASYLNN
jgi:hypothetical protein